MGQTAMSFLNGLDMYPKTLDDVRVRTVGGGVGKMERECVCDVAPRPCCFLPSPPAT